MSATKTTPKTRGRSVSEMGGPSPTRTTSPATKDRIKSAISDDSKIRPVSSPSAQKKSAIPPLRVSGSSIPKPGTSSPQNNQKSLKKNGNNSNEGSNGLEPIQENPHLNLIMPSPRSSIMELIGASIGSVQNKADKALKEKEEELFHLELQKRKAEQEVSLYKERLQKGGIDTEDISSYVHFKNQVEIEQHRVQTLQQELEEKNLIIERLEKSTGVTKATVEEIIKEEANNIPAPAVPIKDESVVQELEEIKQRNSRQEEIIANLIKEKDELSVFKDNVQLEIESIKKELKTQAQKDIDALKNEISSEKHVQNELKEQLEQLTEEHRKVLEDNLKDPESMIELAALKDENDKLRESETYIGTLLDTIEKMKHEKSALQTHSKELDKIKFEHKLLVQRYEDLKAKKERDSDSQHEQALHKLSEEKQNIAEEKLALEKRVLFLENERDKKINENEELIQEAANSKNRIKLLEAQAKEISSSEENQSAKILEEKNSLEKDFSAYKVKMSQQISDLMTQLEEIQRSEALARSKIEDLEVEIETEKKINEENDQFHEIIADQEEEIKHQKEQIDKLVAENEEMDKKVAHLTKQFERSRDQMKNLNVDKNELSQQIETLEKDGDEKEKKIQKLTEELTAAKKTEGNVSQLQKELKELQGVTSGIVSDIEDANNNLAAKKHGLKSKVDILRNITARKTTEKSCKYIMLMNLFLGCLIFAVSLIAFILKPELMDVVRKIALKQ